MAPTEFNLECSLEDIYKGKNTKIKVNRTRPAKLVMVKEEMTSNPVRNVMVEDRKQQ